MAKLNVQMVSDDTVVYDGSIYKMASYPIQEGDIVQASYDLDITDGAFYYVNEVDWVNDFKFYDDVDDYRWRNIKDENYVPYRKAADVTGVEEAINAEPITITINHPVHLIINAPATIEMNGGNV